MTTSSAFAAVSRRLALCALLALAATSPTRAGETITFFHNDVAGSPAVATDVNGIQAWKENYRPYGDQLIDSSAAQNNKLWFTGKSFDDSTGLSYIGARYYDPTLGRFMAVDPVSFNLDNLHSFNRYTYANNNPYKFIDPTGMEAQLAVGGHTDRNPLGHVAIIINDNVYSYGTNWAGGAADQQDWGVNAQVYLGAQAQSRETELMTLSITTAQEQKLQQYLDANNPNASGAPAYDMVTNNCATVVQDALVETGTMPAAVIGPTTARAPLSMSTDSTSLPARVGANAKGAGIVQNVETVGKPPAASWFRAVVNAVRENLR